MHQCTRRSYIWTLLFTLKKIRKERPVPEMETKRNVYFQNKYLRKKYKKSENVFSVL